MTRSTTELHTLRGWRPVRLCAGVGALLLAGCSPSSPPGAPPKTDPAAPHAASTSETVAPAKPVFRDVTAAAGLTFVHQVADGRMDNIMESDGAGGCVLDFDQDGYPDLYLVNSGPAPVLSDAPAGTVRSPNRLYRSKGDGMLEDVTERAGVAGHGFGTTAASADYDNDGWPDLLVVNFGGLILYHNERNGTFADVTDKAGLHSTQSGISATFLDADGDGFLDVFVVNYLKFDPAVKNPPGAKAPYPGPLSYESELNLLYHNRGDGTFEDWSERSGVRVAGHRGMSVTPLDYDLDGDQDLYVCNDGTANLLLKNDGQGRFAEVGLMAGVAVNQFGSAEGSMGAAVGDFDRDGLPDMFVTRFGNASLYVNARGGFFDDRVQPAGILPVSSQHTGWGGNFVDFDNDGDLDLLIVNGSAHFLEQGMPPLLFENRGDGTFGEAGARGGAPFRQRINARGSVVWDADNDGRLDVAVTTLGGQAQYWKNDGDTGNHWLTLKLEGVRGNRDALGALVRVRSGALTQHAESRCPTSYVSQQDARLHFGLGTNRAVERVEIRWPGGQSTSLTSVPVDQVLTVVEPGESRWKRRRE